MKDDLTRAMEREINEVLRAAGIEPRIHYAERRLEKQRIAMHRKVSASPKQPPTRKPLPGQLVLFA